MTERESDRERESERVYVCKKKVVVQKSTQFISAPSIPLFHFLSVFGLARGLQFHMGAAAEAGQIKPG